MSALILIAIIFFFIHKYTKSSPIKASTKMKSLFHPGQFIVFDLETTGLDPSKHEIIEIGAIKVSKNQTRHEGFHALIKPKKKIPARITEINGITNEMVANGQDIDDVLPEFMAFIGNHRLVAYNAKFDMSFLDTAAARKGKIVKNPCSCALNMARRAWPGLPSYKLTHIAEHTGISTEGAHRALEDCKMAATVYLAAAAKLKSIT